MITKHRGHDIQKIGNEFYYCDNNEPVKDNVRPCGYCGKKNTKEGHDGCLGELPGVMNACCGHGNRKTSYIQFQNGFRIQNFEL